MAWMGGKSAFKWHAAYARSRPDRGVHKTRRLRTGPYGVASQIFGFVVVLTPMTHASGQAQPNPNEVTVPETLGGLSVNVKLSAVKEAPALSGDFKVNLTADLTDFKKKAAAMLTTNPDGRRCSNYGINKQAQFQNMNVAVDANKAILSFAGQAQIWRCEPNPIPNSKMVWVGGVPEVKIWDAAPMATLIDNKQVNVSYTLSKDAVGKWTVTPVSSASLSSDLSQLEPTFISAAQKMGDALSSKSLFDPVLSEKLKASGVTFDDPTIMIVDGHLLARSAIVLHPGDDLKNQFITTP